MLILSCDKALVCETAIGTCRCCRVLSGEQDIRLCLDPNQSEVIHSESLVNEGYVISLAPRGIEVVIIEPSSTTQ